MKIDNKKVNDEATDYHLKVIDSNRFMKSSLDSLVDNLSEINIKNVYLAKKKIKLLNTVNLLN